MSDEVAVTVTVSSAKAEYGTKSKEPRARMNKNTRFILH